MKDIEKNRKEIKAKCLEKYNLEANFTIIKNSCLSYLAQLYDEVFFQHFFLNSKQTISYSFSQRLSSSGGYTKKFKTHYEIAISSYLIFNTKWSSQNNILINGLVASDTMDAVMLILEHELIHLYEFIKIGKSSCRQKAFRDLSFDIFGHTAQTHRLETPKKKLISQDIKYGDWVSFRYQGEQRKGILQKVTKRATVFVPHQHGQYTNQNGEKFTKFLVPIEKLTKV